MTSPDQRDVTAKVLKVTSVYSVELGEILPVSDGSCHVLFSCSIACSVSLSVLPLFLVLAGN